MRTRERLFGCVFLALIVVGAPGGCVILPVPTPAHSGVGVITKDAGEFLKPGETTRAEVLLRFGEPAERFEEDRFFVYSAERTHGYLIVGVAAGPVGRGTEIPMTKFHYLAIEFAPDNRLKRFTFIDPWLFQNPRQRLDHWMEEKGESSTTGSRP